MVDAYQVMIGGAQIAGGVGEIGGGCPRYYPTKSRFKRCGIDITFTHGIWNIAAGSAQVITGINDKEVNPPNPLRAVTSGFTSDEGYLYLADFADFIIFDKLSNSSQVGNSSSWLYYANQIGSIGDMTELTIEKYIRPIPVYTTKKNK
jgi:hypothetical protein